MKERTKFVPKKAQKPRNKTFNIMYGNASTDRLRYSSARMTPDPDLTKEGGNEGYEDVY